MEAPTTRMLGPARIVALGLIALAAAGLAYLRLAPDAGRVSVPAGAHAGQLTLEPCTYSTERGGYAADCGTLVVPENRHDAHSRLIALPVTRIHARSSHPSAPIFRLEGGPGLTNMRFEDASRFAGTHDVVLVGYRGIDGSVRLDCPEVVSAMKHAADYVGRAYFTAAAHAYRSCAARLEADGVDLAGYSLPERVDDLEAARRALGYGSVDLISESAGTRTAMIYAWRYPSSIERSVMIGVNPPGRFLWSPQTTDEQIGKYAALCAKDESCSRRTDDLAATFRTTRIPDHWWFLPIRQGNVRLATFFGLMHATPAAAPVNGPMTIDSWLAAANGDASGMWLLSALPQLFFPGSQVNGEVAAAGRIDAASSEAYFAAGRGRGSNLGGAATAFLWAGGRLQHAWPAGPDDDAYSRVRASRVPTLLIGGDLDFATPPQAATSALLPYLPNGRQVVLPGLGHTTDFWSHEPDAGTHLVSTYLATGKVDASRYSHRPVDFTPSTTQAEIAKIVLGVMVGLPALAVLSLIALALRVRSRGRLGRKSAATVRSAVAAGLGLGGWLAGALVVLAALPGIGLDSDVVAGISIGVPVALGIYCGWARREWSPRTKATGLAAALAGALVGAWLGCNATAGLVAVLTATVGAAAGANLILLVLDIAAAAGSTRRGRVAAGDPLLIGRP